MSKLKEKNYDDFVIYLSKKENLYAEYYPFFDKIVISENLPNILSLNELRAIIYHERGHQIRRFKYVPSLLLFWNFFRTMKKEEHSADSYSVKNNNSMKDLFSALDKLKNRRNSWWYKKTHPTDKERQEYLINLKN